MDFWSNALPLMDKKGVKQKDIVDLTGHSSGRVSDWIKEKVIPKADDALKIADMLDVSVRFLLTGQNDKELSTREKKLLKICSILPDDKFEAVVDIARIMRKDVEAKLDRALSSGVSDKERV
jgi:transcriptional regulator with XRE-family HTH domain